MNFVLLCFSIVCLAEYAEPGICSSDGSFVTCSDFGNDRDFVRVVRKTLKQKTYLKFEIRHSTMSYVPADAFRVSNNEEAYNIKWLSITHCVLGGLTETDQAFQGLESSLRHLRISDSTILGHWGWSVLADLKNLSWITMVSVPMDTVQDMGSLNKSDIQRVAFYDCSVSIVESRAFEGLLRLERVDLERNRIACVSRSMFPDPALYLQGIELSYNMLERLPADIFSNMPALVDLRLSGNKLLVLEERIFGIVWGQLESFEAEKIYLHCDCRLLWTLERKFPRICNVHCHNPYETHGRKLVTLEDYELRCL